jgi:Bacterial protein of unknown function (DUF916)
MKRHHNLLSSFAIIALAILTGAAFFGPARALAQDTPYTPDTESFGFAASASNDQSVISHGYFVYKLSAGSKATGSVVVTNKTDKSLTVQLAAVDGLTSQTGGTAFTTAGTPVSATGTWLELGEESLTLEPGASRLAYFTVSVPGAAAPGQYLGGLSAFIADEAPVAQPSPGADQFSATVTIRSRYVIAVQVDIPGQWAQSIDVESVQLERPPSGPYIGVQMRNDGKVFVKPQGSLTITGKEGEPVLDREITLGTFVPGTTIVYPVRWSGELAQGTYQVRVDLKYGDNGSTSYTGQLEVRAEVANEAASTEDNSSQVPGTISDNRVETKIGAASQANRANGPTQAEGATWAWLIVALASVLLVAALIMLSPDLDNTRTAQAGG